MLPLQYTLCLRNSFLKVEAYNTLFEQGIKIFHFDYFILSKIDGDKQGTGKKEKIKRIFHAFNQNIKKKILKIL